MTPVGISVCVGHVGVAALLCLVVSSCASHHRAYGGPERSEAELARVSGTYLADGASTRIKSVDGEKVGSWFSAAGSIDVLPGVHVFGLEWKGAAELDCWSASDTYMGVRWMEERGSVTLVAEPGHHYGLSYGVLTTGVVGFFAADFGKKLTSSSPKGLLEVETSGPPVSSAAGASGRGLRGRGGGFLRLQPSPRGS